VTAPRFSLLRVRLHPSRAAWRSAIGGAESLIRLALLTACFFANLLCDPSLFGGFFRSFGSRSAANCFMAAIGDLRLVSASPQFDPFPPSSMAALCLNLVAHDTESTERCGAKVTQLLGQIVSRWSLRGGGSRMKMGIAGSTNPRAPRGPRTRDGTRLSLLTFKQKIAVLIDHHHR
jgi:hypothetical protein